MSTNEISDLENPENPGGTEGGNQNESVKYETYKRTLGQKKKLETELLEAKERLAEIERKEQEAEEKRLAEQGEYKKLLDLERKKREENEQKVKSYEKNLLDAHKLNAFKEKLPGKIRNNAYYDFVDINKIVLDPETGHVDETSLNEVVNDFVSEHSALLDLGQKRQLPDNAPGSTTALTYDEWVKLPLDERKKRYREMRQNDLNK